MSRIGDLCAPTACRRRHLTVFDGDLGAVREFLDAARASIEADLARLEAGIGERDAPVVVEAAHHLRGTAGDLGADRLVTLCSRIELASGDDFWPIVALLVDDVRKALVNVIAQIGRLASVGGGARANHRVT